MRAVDTSNKFFWINVPINYKFWKILGLILPKSQVDRSVLFFLIRQHGVDL